MYQHKKKNQPNDILSIIAKNAAAEDKKSTHNIYSNESNLDKKSEITNGLMFDWYYL